MIQLHVAWFEAPSRYPVRWDLVLSTRTLLALVLSAAAVGALFLLQRLVGDSHWPRIWFLPKMALGAPTLLAVQAAITLIYSGVQPVMLAPHLQVRSWPWGLILGVCEIAIGFAYLTGLADRAASLLLAGLVATSFLLFPPLEGLALLHWLGLALVIFVIGRQADQAGRPRDAGGLKLPVGPSGAVTGLRILTGIAIIAPALSEKVWNPAIAQAFLHHHPQFNVPHYFLGMSWFSDDLFILAAGVAEFVIGVLLMTGLLTRVVILGMWLPFNLTVPFLPAPELIWHLPILGIIYFLLVHGANMSPDTDSARVDSRDQLQTVNDGARTGQTP
ncbi:MAG: hypothetical protein M3Z13_07295 [Candidatus Dormibacteraeota bacterium]|nr:hypothetical protein [Candidatus Dormibacteraeota bacterium]